MGMRMQCSVSALSHRDRGQVFRLDAILMHIALRHEGVGSRYADTIWLLEFGMPHLDKMAVASPDRKPVSLLSPVTMRMFWHTFASTSAAAVMIAVHAVAPPACRAVANCGCSPKYSQNSEASIRCGCVNE